MRISFLLIIYSLALTALSQPHNIITVNVENDAVRRYLSEVKYLVEDTSRVFDYNVPPPNRRDIPNPAIVPIPDADADELLLTYADNADFSEGVQTITLTKGTTEAAIYNLTPQRTYYYKVTAGDSTVSDGEIHTEGQVRMIYVPKANNIRDIGGWPTADGRRIKYGKLFRGSELNGLHDVDSAGIAILTEQLGIQAEINMRTTYEKEYNISAFGFNFSSSGICDYPPCYLTYNSGQLPEDLYTKMYLSRWKMEFHFIVNSLKRNRNVYFHCVWGGDRTGYLALFLEGLLGVDYDGLMKDYELSSFYNGTRVKERIQPVMDSIMVLEGKTLQEKFNTFFIKKIGSLQSYVDYFRETMLEGVKGDDDSGFNDPIVLRQNECYRPAAVYDLRGRKTGKSGKRGIVIEIDRDGTARKIVR